jgi:hypothetical protein
MANLRGVGLSHAFKKDMVYSLLSVAGMVPIMLTYNVLLNVGFHQEAIIAIVKQIVPLLIVAFVVQKFFVAYNVFALYSVLVSPRDSPRKHQVVMTLLWVTGMCLSMSMYATLVQVGTENNFWQHYITAVLRNYPVALIAQAFVVGPLVRAMHRRLFPAPAYVGGAAS